MSSLSREKHPEAQKVAETKQEILLKDRPPKGQFWTFVVDAIMAFACAALAHYMVQSYTQVAVVLLVFIFTFYALRVNRRLRIHEQHIDRLLHRE